MAHRLQRRMCHSYRFSNERISLTSMCRSFEAMSKRRDFGTSGTIVVDNPYNSEVYCEVPEFDEAEIIKRAEVAKSAQKKWKLVPLSDRIELCDRTIKEFHKNADVISADISGMTGKPLANARGEISGMEERARAMMEISKECLADEILPEKNNFSRRIIKEPVGTVFVVAPWNYPLLTSVNSIIPAVLAGNAVLIKHSGRSPLCANHFADAFAAAGAPEGLVQVANCNHTTCSRLIQSKLVDYVAFTGSVRGGQAIYETVGNKTFIDATLELGGKDAAYVAADADVNAAAEGLVDGAFFNAGQSCCGIERVYVHSSKYDKFLELATKLVSNYKLGDPKDPNTTMGPMATPQSIDFLHQQVKDATRKGARLLTGGQPCVDASGKGRFFAPTLLCDCNHTMDIMTEESFGPVLGVCSVESDEEAIHHIHTFSQYMNDSQYGLTAAIFTKDENLANWMAPKLEVGTICDYLDPFLPWTGTKDTGKGVSLSTHGFDALTKLKSFHFKINPNL